MSKPRVLFVGPYPPPYSGPEAAMKLLLESGIREDFDVVFLNTNFRSSLADKAKRDAALVLAFFSFLWRLLRVIRRHRPAIVYYFVTATRLGWLGRDVWCIFVSKVLGCKMVIHHRAGHFARAVEAMTAVERALVRLACSMVSLCIVQAEVLRREYAGLVQADRLRVIYNAVDCELLQNPDPDDYDPNLFLYLGILSTAKGYCDLVSVIPAVAQRYPKVKFVFAGTVLARERNVFHNQLTGEPLTIEDPADCRDRHIGERYAKNYCYAGMVYGERKHELLRCCNALILPSYSEGFSMSVLEAIAMGKPAICTPVGALGEVIKDGVNGLVVAPGDRGGLCQAIEKMLTDSALHRCIADTNYRYARSRFAVNRIAADLASIFREVLTAPTEPGTAMTSAVRHPQTGSGR